MFAANKLTEVRWECVHFCDRDDIKSMDNLRSLGFKIFEADLEQVSTKKELLASLASAMCFPAYFAMNWDAFDECLRDLGWSPASGYLLIARHAENLWRRNPRIAAQLLQSWIFSAEEWSHEGVPFHLVFVW